MEPPVPVSSTEPAHSPHSSRRVYIATMVLLYHRPCNMIAESGTPALVRLTRSRWLSLQSNDLSGELPAELGSLSNLQELILDSNFLSGCVPSSLEDQLDNLDNSTLGGLPYC